MNRNRAVLILAILMITSTTVLLTGINSLWMVSLAGLFFVIGGTLMTTLISEKYDRIMAVARDIPSLFQEYETGLGRDQNTFMRIAENYRRGNIHHTEQLISQLTDPFLRLGAQSVIDRCSREELERYLLWRLSNNKEEKSKRLHILQTMAGFAPAFGMLGTLFGLVQLLFNLGESGLEQAGSAMGFAMITTVYGLITANLLIKPISIKLEQRNREQLAFGYVKYELLVMLHNRDNPIMMQESLEGLLASSDNYAQNEAQIRPVNLARA